MKFEVYFFDVWLCCFINYFLENFYFGVRIGGILNFNIFYFFLRSCCSGDKYYVLRDLIVLRVFFVYCDFFFLR